MPQRPYQTPGGAVVDAILETLAAREQQQAEAAKLAQQQEMQQAIQAESNRRFDATFGLQQQQFDAAQADLASRREMERTTFDQAQADRQVSRLTPGVIAPSAVDMGLQTRAGNAPLFREESPMMVGGAPIPGVMAFRGTPEQQAASAAAAKREQDVAGYMATLPPAARLQAQGQALGLPVNADLIQPKPQGDSGSYITMVSPDWKQQRRVTDGQAADALFQQGWQEFDRVAARSSKPAVSSEAMDTMRETRRLAEELRNHPGMPATFGIVDSQLPTISQTTADAEQLLTSLRSLLTLENMGKMKGVLSDSDMKVLQAASTTLATRMGDKAAATELKRIVDAMDRGLRALNSDGGTNGGATSGPPVGTRRMINGQMGEWDGKGWKAVQ